MNATTASAVSNNCRVAIPEFSAGTARLPRCSSFARRDEDGLRAKALATHLIQNIHPANPKGSTFCAVSFTLPYFPPGVFIASLSGHGLILNRLPSQEELTKWLKDNLDVLVQSGHYVGHWLEPVEQRHHLDVSIAISGLERALEFARRNQQTSIFYPAEGICIQVPERKPMERQILNGTLPTRL